MDQDILSGLSGFLSGIFGHSGDPYKDASKQYDFYTDKAEKNQNPFIDAGHGAIGDFQDWLKQQKDPSGFINKLMGDYKQSDYAKNLTRQSTNNATNAASAQGLIGSSPLTQQIQQNSSNIASADQNQWLQNVLGINTNYGKGQESLMSGGRESANAMNSFYQQIAQMKGNAAYGQTSGQNKDRMNMISGILKMLIGA